MIHSPLMHLAHKLINFRHQQWKSPPSNWLTAKSVRYFYYVLWSKGTLGTSVPCGVKKRDHRSHWISMKTCHIWDEPTCFVDTGQPSERQKDMHNCIQRILPSPNHQESYKFYENLIVLLIALSFGKYNKCRRVFLTSSLIFPCRIRMKQFTI